VVANHWNQQTVQCWWFNLGGGGQLRTSPGTARLTKSFNKYFLITFREFQIYHFPTIVFAHWKHSALKHRRILKPVFLFTALKTKNTSPSTCYERSKWSALYQRSSACFRLCSFACCLLPCVFRCESDCKYTSYRYVKGWSTDDVPTGSTVTKINITLSVASCFWRLTNSLYLRNWPTSCFAITFFVKESVELFGKQGFLFTSGFKLDWMRAVMMTWQSSLETGASACWNFPMGLEGNITAGRKMNCQNRHPRKTSDFLRGARARNLAVIPLH